MKYAGVIIVSLAVGGIVIGDGVIRSKRAPHETSARQGIAALSIQELARRSQECDQWRDQGSLKKHEGADCDEVWRVIEDRPMQAVHVEDQ
jgi:hypothetical protein